MVKNIKIKVFLIELITSLFSGINKIIPKDNSAILIYNNHEFRDNNKSLYDYLINNGYNKDYKIICASTDYKRYKVDCKNNVRFVSPIGAFAYYMRSVHVFYSFGRIPITPSDTQVVIQMWHGTSFKGFTNRQQKTNKEKWQFYTHVYASSEYFKPIVAKKFAVQEESIVLCGHPRTDVFYDDSIKLYDVGTCEKLIIWLPTFRRSGSLGIYDSNEHSFLPVLSNDEINELDKYLKEISTIIIVKLHPEQDIEEFDKSNLSNIKLMTNQEFEEKGYELYPLLKQSDALITDYSSVFYDYLLLDKPIGFTEDDIETYKKKRNGFAIDDLEKFRPGEKIKCLEELKIFLENVFNGNDQFANDRREINDIANQYQDGCNCKRTLQYSRIINEEI